MDLDDLHTPPGEGIALEERRELQKMVDFARGGKFRVDRHGEAEFLAHQHKLLGILRIAHAGDGVLRA